MLAVFMCSGILS